MENKVIIKQLKLLAKFAAFWGEDNYKIRAYEEAAQVLQEERREFSILSQREWEEIPKIGKSLRHEIQEALTKGRLPKLITWEEKTPEGLHKLFSIRGLGPGKLGKLWRSLGVTSSEELRKACQAHRVASVKGFGEKSEAQIKAALTFYEQNKSRLRWCDALELAEQVEKHLSTKNITMKRTGQLQRAAETLAHLEWQVLSSVSFESLTEALQDFSDYQYEPPRSGIWVVRGSFLRTGLTFSLHLRKDTPLWTQTFLKESSAAHLALKNTSEENIYETLHLHTYEDPATLYQTFDCAEVPVELREGGWTKPMFQTEALQALITPQDLQGILHVHSTYSDGKDTLQDIALYVKNLGYAYLGITDHSRSAFYAHGLQVADIERQTEEIDKLNHQLSPFRILKGIECDVLADGSLDYPDEILARFDFVIASVHSGLSMNESTATQRLLSAIHHPYTSILGHISGGLLLERAPYPLDYHAILATCAEQKVAIEFNANPYRMDIDWRWLCVAQNYGVKICITPDAHTKEDIEDTRKGVLFARKGGVRKDMILNTYSTEKLCTYFTQRVKK